MKTNDIQESKGLATTEVSASTLVNRRGYIILPLQQIQKPDENLLRAIFSNIFPVTIAEDHSRFMYNAVKYYCYSPLFDELESNYIAPQYEVIVENKDEENFDISVRRID